MTKRLYAESKNVSNSLGEIIHISLSSLVWSGFYASVVSNLFYYKKFFLQVKTYGLRMC